jgi:Lantibiotic dehydratase, N terminus
VKAGGSAPLIARLSGLPASTMSAFASPLAEHLDAIARHEEQLSSARQEFVDRLHAAIHNAPAERRHCLLSVKRDAFNGRPLARHRSKAAWVFVEQVAPELAHLILELETTLEQLNQNFLNSYTWETNRQYRELDGLIDHPAFRCGLAVGNHTVAAEVHCLKAKVPEEYGRREKRFATTLLRYASRASLKLSPFSTFTPVGLCRVDAGAEPLKLLSGEWSRSSLVRLRRHVLDRCTDFLCLYEPWRRTLSVDLNDSVAQLDDGRTLHRRPGRFSRDEETQQIRYQRESLVRARFQDDFIERLHSLLAAGPVAYGELLSLLASEMNAAHRDYLREKLDQLIDLGFLHLVQPWSADVGHLETVLLQELLRLPRDPALQVFIDLLNQLVMREETLLQAADPAKVLEEIKQTMEEMVLAAARIAQLPLTLKVPSNTSAHDIYQDVWCAPQFDKCQPIASVGRAPLEHALRSIEPLLRYSRLFDHHLDLLFSVGSLLERQRGKACRLTLLNAFDIARDLFQEFIAHQAQVRSTEQQYGTWNPLKLAVIDHLSTVRESARQAMQSCFIDGDGGRTISTEHLTHLLDDIPIKFRRYQGGGCLFLQPATTDGSLWVINRLKEGTGRMSSRYTPLMPEPLRYHYADDLARRASIEQDNHPIPLLDISCIGGDTLNVHVPQTPCVLVLPGAQIDLPRERRVTLNDLLVSIHDGWPTLEDRRGQRHLATFIGLAGSTYLPTLVKFLCAFGPTDTIPLYPSRLEKMVSEIAIRERTYLGNIVLTRKNWCIPVKELRLLFDHAEGAVAFERLHRFRQIFGIPQRVFVSERLTQFPRGTYYKPQYLDLSSPLFMSILRSIVLAAEDSLTFVEMLPQPESFLRDAKGQQWAVELLVDAVALQAPSWDVSVFRHTGTGVEETAVMAA